jgi:hypothetical protein
MDPKLFAEIAVKNGPDLEAIIAIFGIANIVKAMPHFMNILATVQAQQK